MFSCSYQGKPASVHDPPGAWEFQTRHLNMLASVTDAIGTPTNTTGGPASLRGANCKTQTGTGYGHWCCLSDLITNKKYCRVGHERNGLRCGDEPLSRTMILGQAMCIGRRLIMLCGNCGGCFVLYSVNYCMFTERGYVCQHCTSFLRKAELFRLQARGLGWELDIPHNAVLPLAVTPEERKQREASTRAPVPRCVACNVAVVRSTKQFSKVRVYEHGLLVCYKDSYALNVKLNAVADEMSQLSAAAYRERLVACESECCGFYS